MSNTAQVRPLSSTPTAKRSAFRKLARDAAVQVVEPSRHLPGPLARQPGLYHLEPTRAAGFVGVVDRPTIAARILAVAITVPHPEDAEQAILPNRERGSMRESAAAPAWQPARVTGTAVIPPGERPHVDGTRCNRHRQIRMAANRSGISHYYRARYYSGICFPHGDRRSPPEQQNEPAGHGTDERGWSHSERYQRHASNGRERAARLLGTAARNTRAAELSQRGLRRFHFLDGLVSPPWRFRIPAIPSSRRALPAQMESWRPPRRERRRHADPHAANRSAGEETRP